MTRRPLVRLLAGTVLTLGLTVAGPAPAAVAPAQPGAPGIGDDYFRWDGNGGIDVRHYDIHDRYRFRTRRLSGHTTLTVRATERLSSFNLDFLLPVRRVRVDGVVAEFSRPRRHELRVVPPRPLPAGEQFTVRVSYDGHPGRFRYAGERNWLADRHEVVAMNQPHMAPWWFPANDHPSDKARMAISITVPRGRHAVANGRRVGVRRHGGLVTRRFVSKEPMATYLATFAAGRFAVRTGSFGGVRWRAVVSRQLSSEARRANMALMLRTPRIIKALQRDLGDYPFTRAGGLVTGLPVGFALENQTMPTYPVTGRGYTRLVVHEQAHQWFGDSVAVERWRDIWLNEGAASFMEVRYAATHGGVSARRWLRRRYDATGRRAAFWDLPIGDPGADRMFDQPVYVRGAMTFQALRNRIGNADFWTLVRSWLADHAGGNASTDDFVALAEQVSGERLDGFFDAWLGAGRPADTAANGLGPGSVAIDDPAVA